MPATLFLARGGSRPMRRRCDGFARKSRCCGRSANLDEGDFVIRRKSSGHPFVWNPTMWLIHIREPVGGCRIPGYVAFD